MHPQRRNHFSRKTNAINIRPIESADSLTVRLRYPIRGTLATVGTVISKRWQPNAAYDVDPVLGSTSTPGFAEYATLYSYYRVCDYKVSCTFSNLDNLGVSLYIVNTNTDPGTAGTNYYNYAQSALGRTYELAPFYSGTGTVKYTQRVPVHRVLGMSPTQADSFRSVVTSAPTDLVYWGFGIYSNVGTNFANGISYTGFIEMTVRFYARQELLTSFFTKTSVELEAERQIWKMTHYIERDAKTKERESRCPEKEFEEAVQAMIRMKLSQNKSLAST